MTQKNEKEFQFNNFGHQYYTMLIANIIMISNGCAIGWYTPVLPLLISEDTPLQSGPLSLHELSWVGSLISLGGLTGSLTLGYVIKSLGVKRMMTYTLLPIKITFWLLIIYGTTSLHIMIARFISGVVSSGIDQALVLLVAEIADDRIRGQLASLQLLSRSIGYFLMFTVGAFVQYSLLPYVFISLPVIFFLGFAFLPSTPHYLIASGKYPEAKKSIKYYKNCKCETFAETQAIEIEFQRLYGAIAENENKPSYSLSNLLKPNVFKAIMIGILLTLLNQMSGSFMLLTYAVTIFQESGSHIDGHICSIILGGIQIVGNLCTTQLVDTLGRKKLLIISVAGCSLGMSTMSMYTYLLSQGFDLSVFHWIPIISLGFVIFISSIGIIPLALVCVVELLPLDVRNFGLMICMVAINIFSFTSVKLFPILTSIIHLYGSMSIYAVGCALGTIFIAKYIKETKGISLETNDNGNKNINAA